MPTYNPNDFYPRTGAEIDSSGNVKNDADGLNSDGSKNVVTTGRKTQQILGHQALAVRDATNHDVTIDISTVPGYKGLVVNNTTDQTATVVIYASASNYSFAGMGAGKTVNSGATTLFTDNDFNGLRLPLQKLTIRISFSTPPASGAVSSFIEGTV